MFKNSLFVMIGDDNIMSKEPTKNPVGRPPKYSNPEDLQKKIDEYFTKGVEEIEILYGSAKDGVHREKVKCPTITGLVLYCGFCDRQSFYDYEKRPEFSHIIKKARARIVREYEQQLRFGNTTGAIFALKNFGWSDKQEVAHTGDIGLTINIKRTEE